VAHLVFFSTALAFLTNMSKECNSTTSSSAIQVKNQQKTLVIEYKLYVISQFEKGNELLADVLMLRLAHSSICTIPDNADRIKESAKCSDNITCQQSETGSVCLCSRATTVLLDETMQKTMDLSLLHFFL